MRVAICDDSDLERNLLHVMLQKYFSEMSIKCDFSLYNRGDLLCYDVMEDSTFDIIFLDLFMGDSFGINVAKKLRDLSYNNKIVFCTVSADYALESYQVYAFGYILKPFSMKEIRKVLDRILTEYQSESFLVKQKSKHIYIPLNEIVFVESDNAKCVLHRINGTEYTIYKKLGQIQSELNDSRFLRSHQSYLVNMNYISEVRDYFVLRNGEEILIRQKSKNELIQQFFQYKKTYGVY